MSTFSLTLLVKMYWYKTTHLLKKNIGHSDDVIADEGQPDNRQLFESQLL